MSVSSASHELAAQSRQKNGTQLESPIVNDISGFERVKQKMSL